MKYGLELEWFVRKNGELCKVDTKHLPYDECGYLVEARGAPASSIRDAVFLLMAEMSTIENTAESLGYSLIKEPLAVMPKEVMLDIRREFSKGVTSYQNLYGYKEHRNGKFSTAGLHISFTNPVEIEWKDGIRRSHNSIFDFVSIFRKLDEAFEEEIRNAKRLPGFYELKHDGRIEYRSLPNNVDLMKVIRVLS